MNTLCMIRPIIKSPIDDIVSVIVIALYLIIVHVIGIWLVRIVEDCWDFAKEKVLSLVKEWKARRHHKKNDPSKQANNLVEIYSHLDGYLALYNTTTTETPVEIPVVPTFLEEAFGPLESTSDFPFSINHENRRRFDFSEKRIRSLKEGGRKLWDGPLLCVTGTSLASNQSVINASICNYFSYVDIKLQAAKEANSTKGSKPIVVDRANEIARALLQKENFSFEFGPIALAVSATCVFESENGPSMVALHGRSSEVVSGHKLFGVSPSFALEPNRIGELCSEYGVITFNVLKEILEEFHNQPEIECHNYSPSAIHPDAIFESENGKRLTKELDEGNVAIHYTGAIVDPSDSSLIIAILVHFTSPEYAKWFLNHARGNWEASDRVGEPKIIVRSLYGESIEEMMSLETMMPPSIFSLDRARAYLHNQDRNTTGGDEWV